MMRYAGLALRLLILAIFWWSAAIVIHYGALGAGNSSIYGSGGLIAFIVAFVVIAGFAFTERLLRVRVSFGVQEEKPAPRKTAPVVPPEALRLRDMISLLDEEDLDDLRAEVREGLRDRIRNLTADESETFEELLSDPKRKRR